MKNAPIRKRFLSILTPVVLLMGGYLLTGYTPPAPLSLPPKPNIVYIYADDLGYAELGIYGQKKIRTPHLDRIGREGIKFTDYYTSTPVCAPSRCQLLTGTHGGHSYIRGNYEMGGFPDSTERGQMPLSGGHRYHRYYFAKARLQNRLPSASGAWAWVYSTGSPNQQGFDYFYGYYDQKQAHNYYPTHLWENGQRDTLNNPVIDVHRRLTPKRPRRLTLPIIKATTTPSTKWPTKR